MVQGDRPPSAATAGPVGRRRNEHGRHFSPGAVPAAQGLTREDFRRVQEVLDHSVSANTRTMYRSSWTLHLSPGCLGPAGLGGCLLLPPGRERRLSVATIRLHKAALDEVHKANGHGDPTDNEGVRRILQGISRAQRQAKPPPTAEDPWPMASAGSRPKRPPGGEGWTSPSCESCWTDCCRRSEAAAPTWGRRGAAGQRHRPDQRPAP